MEKHSQPPIEKAAKLSQALGVNSMMLIVVKLYLSKYTTGPAADVPAEYCTILAGDLGAHIGVLFPEHLDAFLDVVREAAVGAMIWTAESEAGASDDAA